MYSRNSKLIGNFKCFGFDTSYQNKQDTQQQGRQCTYIVTSDGFGGLVVSLVPEFAGSNPTEAVGFFSDVKKSSACLPSEGK
jgi:hypothetical protein